MSATPNSAVSGSISRTDAADRAGVGPEHVTDLIDAGLLTPDEQGRLTSSDVRRIGMIESTLRAGLPLEGLAEGFRRGLLSLDFVSGPEYVEDRILPVNPFQTLDDAVAGLMKTAVDKGRSTKPGIELGICGEHGGDPESIHKCERIGLDYVSCSPFRVPVARLAAAQAVLANAAERDR